MDDAKKGAIKALKIYKVKPEPGSSPRPLLLAAAYRAASCAGLGVFRNERIEHSGSDDQRFTPTH
jgi:hypothetical protein